MQCKVKKVHCRRVTKQNKSQKSVAANERIAKKSAGGNTCNDFKDKMPSLVPDSDSEQGQKPPPLNDSSDEDGDVMEVIKTSGFGDVVIGDHKVLGNTDNMSRHGHILCVCYARYIFSYRS